MIEWCIHHCGFTPASGCGVCVFACLRFCEYRYVILMPKQISNIITTKFHFYIGNECHCNSNILANKNFVR